MTGYTQAYLLIGLNIARVRSDVCNQIREKSDIKAKEALLDPLVSENKWTKWERSLIERFRIDAIMLKIYLLKYFGAMVDDFQK